MIDPYRPQWLLLPRAHRTDVSVTSVVGAISRASCHRPLHLDHLPSLPTVGALLQQPGRPGQPSQPELLPSECCRVRLEPTGQRRSDETPISRPPVP